MRPETLKELKRGAEQVERNRRTATLERWLQDATVIERKAEQHGYVRCFMVGEAMFRDKTRVCPSEKLIAEIGLALQAGLHNERRDFVVSSVWE